MHQVDCLVEILDGEPFGWVVQLDALVNLLRFYQVDNITELFLGAIVANFALLNLQHFDELPFEEVVVLSEPVLNL